MTKKSPVLKDIENELPVPNEWRHTLFKIVEAFNVGDFTLERSLDRVRPISIETAQIIKSNIDDYPAQLASLPGETWNTSIYLWMDAYWQVLVDLFVLQDGISDLVLDVRVFEDGVAGYVFEVQLVYVP